MAEQIDHCNKNISDNNNNNKQIKPNKKGKYCIHIFRRDYRLVDNTSLLAAIKKGYTIIPIFVFTPVQIEDKRNKYKSHTCLRFLIESLEDLDTQLSDLGSKLHIFYGDDISLIKKMASHPDVGAVSFNRDYTAYAHKRDTEIAKICKSLKSNNNNNNVSSVELICMDDTLLQPLGKVCTGSGNTRKPYSKFTPFYRSAKQYAVPKPNKQRVLSRQLLSSRSTAIVSDVPNSIARNITRNWKYIHSLYTPSKVHVDSKGQLLETPGRKAGLSKLSQMKKWDNYGDCRNELSYETTHLSAYLKFGCISVREVYWNIRSKIGRVEGEPLLRQLYWRDFFYILSSAYPRVYKESLDSRRHGIKWWSANTDNWKAWTTGNTGYPIVDACMRELNATGYMHNRGRLIASNFLVRLLHINWQDGERYFAQHLYDYDPAQNNFGWQVSSAVSGTESRPISQTLYNPWLQTKKYDSEGKFIKKWCPELKDVPASDLNNWDKKHIKWVDKGCPLEGKYPMPIVDYKDEKKKDGELFGY